MQRPPSSLLALSLLALSLLALSLLTALSADAQACVPPLDAAWIDSIGLIDDGAPDGGLAVLIQEEGLNAGFARATVAVTTPDGAAIAGAAQKLASFNDDLSASSLWVWQPEEPLAPETTYSAAVAVFFDVECAECAVAESTVDVTTSADPLGDLAPLAGSLEVGRLWEPVTERIEDELQPSCIWEDVTVGHVDRVQVRARIEGRAAWDRARLSIAGALDAEPVASSAVRLDSTLTVRIDPGALGGDTACAWITRTDPLGRTVRTDLGCDPIPAAGPRPDVNGDGDPMGDRDSESAASGGGCTAAPGGQGGGACLLLLAAVGILRQRR